MASEGDNSWGGAIWCCPGEGAGGGHPLGGMGEGCKLLRLKNSKNYTKSCGDEE